VEVLKSLPHGLNEIGLEQDYRPSGRWCRFGGGEKAPSRSAIKLSQVVRAWARQSWP
jgi:hypothetical protein